MQANDSTFLVSRQHGAKFGRRALLKGAFGVGAGLAAAAVLNPTASSLAGLAKPQAIAAAGNDDKLFFFYRQGDGFGAVGTIAGGNFATLRAWAPGTFSTGWTHIVGVPGGGGDFLFYSYNSRLLIRARQEWTTFKQLEVQSNQPYWSSVVATPPTSKPSRYLFYDLGQRAASFGYAPGPTETYAPGTMGGWTHVVAVPVAFNPATGYDSTHQLLIYNGFTGAMALGLGPTVASYGAGYLSANWTHIVATRNGPDAPHDILFYNRYNRLCALARLTADGLGISTIGSSYVGAWTHIVAAGADGFLFCNQNNGDAAIARVQNNTLVTTRSYPRGFSTGWTHIADIDRSIWQ